MRLLRLGGEALHFFAQVCHLRRSHEAEVAAFERAVRQTRQIAAGLDAEGGLRSSRASGA